MTPELLSEYIQAIRANGGTLFFMWLCATITIVLFAGVVRGKKG